MKKGEIVRAQKFNENTVAVIIPQKIVKHHKIVKGMEFIPVSYLHGVKFLLSYKCSKCKAIHLSGSIVFKEHIKFMYK